jgi:parallel beta-helix repeat protein
MKWKLSAAMIFAAAMLAWAASVGAVDGTVEINQAKVTAAGGFPYKITASGSYRLTSNLNPPASTDGLDTSASNVTIDLNGFAIIGPGSSTISPTGVSATGENDVTVENGTVTGFGIGVEVGEFGIVRNVHADVNGSGIQAGDNTVIEDCTANNCTLTIEPAINCGPACTISGNTANGNAAMGIACAGNGCEISDNVAAANAAAGIDCSGIACLISGNVVFSNKVGLEASDGTTGYGGNVLDNNTTRNTSGTSLSNNLNGGSPY